MQNAERKDEQRRGDSSASKMRAACRPGAQPVAGRMARQAGGNAKSWSCCPPIFCTPALRSNIQAVRQMPGLVTGQVECYIGKVAVCAQFNAIQNQRYLDAIKCWSPSREAATIQLQLTDRREFRAICFRHFETPRKNTDLANTVAASKACGGLGSTTGSAGKSLGHPEEACRPGMPDLPRGHESGEGDGRSHFWQNGSQDPPSQMHSLRPYRHAAGRPTKPLKMERDGRQGTPPVADRQACLRRRAGVGKGGKEAISS